MLFHLSQYLIEHYNFIPAFKFITTRAALAAITGFLVSVVSAPRFIRAMKNRQLAQSIRDDGPKTHAAKTGTPSMGGAFVLGATSFATLAWCDLTNPWVWLVMITLVVHGILGGADDWIKVAGRDYHGIAGKTKLVVQGAVSFGILLYLYRSPSFSTDLFFPFFKNLVLPLGLFMIPFGMLVMMGTSNAVNLTDGLDGLVTVPLMTSFATFGLLAYLTGHAEIAHYLRIPHEPLAGEIAIICAALIAALAGFLWYNAYPAEIFMGDVGSLSLGATLGLMALLTKNEILLVIVGGIFVIEAVSVMIQVGFFKRTGRRVFRMAPIHHHFELKGWPEPKVIVRFWIISIVLSIVALVTLKFR
jgi:phospho-N-acetylmuramoyl-pentapeptide-transferase